MSAEPKVDISPEACAVACMLVSNPQFPVNLTKGDIYLLLLCALKLTGEMNMTEIKEWKITEEQNASQYEDGCGCVCGIAMDKASLRHREPGFLSLPHWEPLLKPVSPASDIFP